MATLLVCESPVRRAKKPCYLCDRLTHSLTIKRISEQLALQYFWVSCLTQVLLRGISLLLRLRTMVEETLQNHVHFHIVSMQLLTPRDGKARRPTCQSSTGSKLKNTLRLIPHIPRQTKNCAAETVRCELSCPLRLSTSRLPHLCNSCRNSYRKHLSATSVGSVAWPP